MASKPTIVVSHSDKTLLAELSFWAASAEYDIVARSGRREILEAAHDTNTTAVIVELANQDEEIIDTLQDASRGAAGKIIAICPLDQKTTSSIRRLFEAKSLNVIVLTRDDFNTKLLAGLLDPDPSIVQMDKDALVRSIRNGHVIAYYQPKVPFQQGVEKYGVEALCRIHHPKLGLVYPDSFIPIAEAHGLILELTDAVTLHAFHSLKSWDAAGMQLRLALNISPKLMGDTVWFDLFQHRCQEFDIDPSRITLEVTESASQGSKVLALEILSRLRLKGFLLSIDDFGTGFSSLETLYKLPFGELKIDKGFVFDLHKSPEARALVESTILLARKLGLRICAEGVENEEIFAELRDLKCDDAQGYHISAAIPADQIVPFLQGWTARRRTMAAEKSTSKFAPIHAILADLLTTEDSGEDETIVLSSGPATAADVPPAGRDIAGRIPALVMGGNLLAALELAHHAIEASAAEGDRAFQAKLEKLRAELERGLGHAGPLELRLEGRIVQLLAGSSVTIGRQSPTAKADIAIVCQWLSRGEKNLRLFSDEGSWMIEDLGSTNGHFVNAKRLAARAPMLLEAGDTLVEIGRSSKGTAPAWLQFRSLSGAVHVHFGLGQKDDSSLSEAGPEWMVVADAFSVGGDESADLHLADCGAGFAAEISVREGRFWIAPQKGASIAVNGVVFSQAVPLPAGAELTLGDCACSVHLPEISSVPALAAAATA